MSSTATVDAFTRSQPLVGRKVRKPTRSKQSKVVKGELVLPRLEPFFRCINGYVPGEEDNPSKHNYFCLRDVVKAIWPLYLPLQVIGLVSDRAAMLAKGFYGVCWSIIYSCYRPWKENRDQLVDKNPKKPIASFIKSLYNANEYFRVFAGTVVTAVYAFGSFKMLWATLTGNKSLFEKAQEIYQIGMFNQNAIFASMSAAGALKARYNKNQLEKAFRGRDNVREKFGLIEILLFPITTITRILDTCRLFGMNLNETLSRFTKGLSYFCYGLWAARFGLLKKLEKSGGDLKKVNPNLHGTAKKIDQVLHVTQKHGATVFSILLPALSWLAAISEFFGYKNFAEKTFKLEGILERLLPPIASVCIRDTWMKLFRQKAV